MAGAILIDNDIAISMSSVAFDYILEKTRELFLASEAEVVAAIYRPYDHEGMMFISLVESSPEALNTFYRATSMARSENLTVSLSEHSWKYLCSALEQDPRMSTSQTHFGGSA